MALSYTELQDKIELKLQDTGGSIFSQTSGGEIQETIRDALREFARYLPHIVRVIYYIESRTGSATSDSTSHLVDTANAQFESTDVGKVACNTSDRTYAVITAYTSASDITLSKDIFTDGDENYAIYNKGCLSNKQINLEDVTDYIWVDDIQYPIGTRRQVDSNDEGILTIGLDIEPDDSAESNSNVEVHVYFNKRHKLPQITTFTGAVNYASGYDAGDTSMAINGLQTSGTIEKDQEFTIQYRKEVYTLTADASISSAAATINFYPGLEADVDDGAAITFRKSTLPTEAESLFCDYVLAKVLLSKAILPAQEIINAISVLSTASTAVGNVSNRITQALEDIASGRGEVDKVPTLMVTAQNAIDKIGRELDLAFTDLDIGRTEIESMSPFGDVSNRWRQYAGAGISATRGFLDEAQGYFRQGQGDESIASSYAGLGARELQSAAMSLSQAAGYLRIINSHLSISNSWRVFQEKGERELARVKQELGRMARRKAGVNHPRT